MDGHVRMIVVGAGRFCSGKHLVGRGTVQYGHLMAESRQAVGQPVGINPITAEIIRRIERTDQAESQRLSVRNCVRDTQETRRITE